MRSQLFLSLLILVPILSVAQLTTLVCHIPSLRLIGQAPVLHLNLDISQVLFLIMKQGNSMVFDLFPARLVKYSVLCRMLVEASITLGMRSPASCKPPDSEASIALPASSPFKYHNKLRLSKFQAMASKINLTNGDSLTKDFGTQSHSCSTLSFF